MAIRDRRGSSSSRDSSSRGSSRGSASRGRSFYRGEEGMRRSQEELERQKAKAEQRKQQYNQPYRFRVPVGEEREAIILDDKPDFFRYEHNMKDSNGDWKVFTGCVSEYDNCPVCEHLQRDAYYAMYLTVIDLHPFETRSGESVEFSRKLLVVKPAQHKKFMRFYEKEGTLRGALFTFTRDGEKDSAIGNDIEFTGEWYDDDELSEFVREWTDKDKKHHVEDCSEPYNYEEMFEDPDVEQLRALVGAKAPAGSRREEERELGRRDRRRGGREEAEEEDNGGRRSRPGRRGRVASKEDEEEQQEESRSSRRSRRGSSRDEEDTEGKGDWEDPESPPWDDDSGDAKDEQEEKPARRGSRRSDPEPEEKPTRRAPRGRSRDVEEDKPAARRIQPRRGAR